MTIAATRRGPRGRRRASSVASGARRARALSCRRARACCEAESDETWVSAGTRRRRRGARVALFGVGSSAAAYGTRLSACCPYLSTYAEAVTSRRLPHSQSPLLSSCWAVLFQRAQRARQRAQLASRERARTDSRRGADARRADRAAAFIRTAPREPWEPHGRGAAGRAGSAPRRRPRVLPAQQDAKARRPAPDERRRRRLVPRLLRLDQRPADRVEIAFARVFEETAPACQRCQNQPNGPRLAERTPAGHTDPPADELARLVVAGGGTARRPRGSTTGPRPRRLDGARRSKTRRARA